MNKLRKTAALAASVLALSSVFAPFNAVCYDDDNEYDLFYSKIINDRDMMYDPRYSDIVEQHYDEVFVDEEAGVVIVDGRNLTTRYVDYVMDETNENELCIKGIRNDSPLELTIPERIGDRVVTSVGGSVCYNNPVRILHLPDTIKYMEKSAFCQSRLISVNIPESLEYIPESAFASCKKLTRVEWSGNLRGINSTAFEESRYELPEEYADLVTDDDFYYTERDGMIYRIFPGGSYPYKSVVLAGFNGSSESITLPLEYEGLPFTIDNELIYETPVSTVTFPEEYREIDLTPFSYESITELIFESENVNIKGDISEASIKSFELSTSVITATLPKTMEEIIVHGDGTLHLGSSCFSNTQIREFVSDRPCIIDQGCFADAPMLERVVISSDVILGSRVFMRCPKMEYLEVTGELKMTPRSLADAPALTTLEYSGGILENPEYFAMCQALRVVNGIPVFNKETGEFSAEYKEIAEKNFLDAEDIGFMNDFVEWNIKKVAAEIITDDMNDMQKVRAIHDWICDQTEYVKYTDEKELDPLIYHVDASVFVSPETVCEGYAKACNLLFHEVGLETMCVSGVNHVWNIVKIGDHWFHFDSTWDDQLKSYDWFLRADDQLYDTKAAHMNIAFFPMSALHSFQGKKLPECDRKMGDSNNDGIISAADLVTVSRYIMGADSGADTVLSDVDYNGVVDVFDMVKLREIITKNK